MTKIKRNKKPGFKKPSPNVSNRMKRVKSSNTKIETTMENLLRKEETLKALDYEKLNFNVKI